MISRGLTRNNGLATRGPLMPQGRTMIGSGGGGVGGPISPYSLPTVPRGTSGLTATGPLNKSQLSVSEMMGSNARGGPNISNVTDPVSGRRLTVAEAAARGPLTITGGSGRSRGYGGHGYQRPQSGVSSAGVAGGTPTSRRGRAELALQDDPMLSPEGAWADAERPSWDQPRPDPFAPNPRYGGMGRPPVRSYAEGTKGRPVPFGQAAIVGDSKNGKENREAIVTTADGTHVIPLKDAAAIDQIMGEVGDLSGAPTGIADGEIRLDADGNEWRYDASTGRGVMVNPYIANPNAPSPNAFRASPSERYADLAMRLDSLRQSGFAEGRAAVSRLKGQQAEEQSKREAFLATGKPIVPAEGGGTLYNTPYGPAIVGSNRPRSFTVENFEGGQTTSSDLAEVNRESRADAAERTVRGGGTRGYRALPGAVPSTVEDALPPAAIDQVPRELGEPPVLADRSLGQRPQSGAGIVSRGALDEIEDGSATAPKSPTPIVEPPTNDMARPQLKTKAEEAVVSFLGSMGIPNARGVSFDEVKQFVKNMWDEWFTRGGTASNQEARKAQDALTPEQAKKFNEELQAAFEKVGYRSKKTEDGVSMEHPAYQGPWWTRMF